MHPQDVIDRPRGRRRPQNASAARNSRKMLARALCSKGIFGSLGTVACAYGLQPATARHLGGADVAKLAWPPASVWLSQPMIELITPLHFARPHFFNLKLSKRNGILSPSAGPGERRAPNCMEHDRVSQKMSLRLYET